MVRPTPEALACIDVRLTRHGICLGMATNHDLAAGGTHDRQEHLRLTLTCSEMCHAHAHLLILGSPQARHLAENCAGIRRLCAESCDRVGDMEDCVSGRGAPLRRPGLTARLS